MELGGGRFCPKVAMGVHQPTLIYKGMKLNQLRCSD